MSNTLPDNSFKIAGQRFGQRLRQLRQINKLSLAALAESAGVTKLTLGKIERGEGNPTLSVIWKIANGLGAEMSIDVLNLSSKNTKFNHNEVLSSALISSPVNVPAALDVPSGNSPVTLSTVALGFNKGNSNIDQLISIFPDSLG